MYPEVSGETVIGLMWYILFMWNPSTHLNEVILLSLSRCFSEACVVSRLMDSMLKVQLTVLMCNQNRKKWRTGAKHEEHFVAFLALNVYSQHIGCVAWCLLYSDLHFIKTPPCFYTCSLVIRTKL